MFSSSEMFFLCFILPIINSPIWLTRRSSFFESTRSVLIDVVSKELKKSCAFLTGSDDSSSVELRLERGLTEEFKSIICLMISSLCKTSVTSSCSSFVSSVNFSTDSRLCLRIVIISLSGSVLPFFTIAKISMILSQICFISFLLVISTRLFISS